MFIMKLPVSLRSRYIQQLLRKLSKFVIDARKCFGPPLLGETVLQNGGCTAKGVLDADIVTLGYIKFHAWNKCSYELVRFLRGGGNAGEVPTLIESVWRAYHDHGYRPPARGLHGPGQVAQIMFGSGPSSNDSNQTLCRTFRAFSGHSVFTKKNLFVVALILCS
jgi:hypothetical protein